MTIVNETKQVEQAEAKAAEKLAAKEQQRFIVVVTVIDKLTGKIIDTTDYPTGKCG